MEEKEREGGRQGSTEGKKKRRERESKVLLCYYNYTKRKDVENMY